MFSYDTGQPSLRDGTYDEAKEWSAAVGSSISVQWSRSRGRKRFSMRSGMSINIPDQPFRIDHQPFVSGREDVEMVNVAMEQPYGRSCIDQLSRKTLGGKYRSRGSSP